MGGKWWEFYFVRYAMGTVIGGMIFYTIAVDHSHLSKLLFDTDESSLNSSNIVLLAVYGLAFCYIASAPILVYHAGRCFLVRKSGESAFKRPSIGFSLLLISTAVTFGLCWYWLVVGESAADTFLGATWIASFWFLTAPQFWLAMKLCIKPQVLKHFYTGLAYGRANLNEDIVESYRHLREHGNSFLIVIFEILLGLMVIVLQEAPEMNLTNTFGIDSYAYLQLLALLLWLLPAAVIWLVATQLENDLNGVM